jgi:hypothetical protein
MKQDINKCRDDALVQKLSIAAPCDVPWDSMEGDERTRFCSQCKLNVYNIAEMSTKDAAALVRKNEGKVCLKLYMRADGTVITDNCPVGLRKIRDRMKRVAVAVITSLAWVGLISSAQAQGLVGAPIDSKYGVPVEIYNSASDPRYGLTGDVGYLPAALLQKQTSNIFLNLASWISCMLLAIMLFSKRARVPLVGVMLLSIWAVTGFMIGIASVSSRSDIL